MSSRYTAGPKPLKRDGISPVSHVGAAKYATVAASQTTQAVSSTVGDCLEGLLIVPATTAPGNVIVKDTTTNTVFTGGSGSVTGLVPFYVPFGARSVSGPWKITTGANVSVIAFGHWL